MSFSLGSYKKKDWKRGGRPVGTAFVQWKMRHPFVRRDPAISVEHFLVYYRRILVSQSMQQDPGWLCARVWRRGCSCRRAHHVYCPLSCFHPWQLLTGRKWGQENPCPVPRRADDQHSKIALVTHHVLLLSCGHCRQRGSLIMSACPSNSSFCIALAQDYWDC